MLPDRVSNPGPLTYESGALPIVLRGPALQYMKKGLYNFHSYCWAVEDDFCAETEAERQSVAETFERRLVVAAGSGTSLDISSEIRNCIINNCGGCPNQGKLSFYQI